MPKVSIVLPIYNVENYLKQCLESVVNQSLRDIEIICVNDGSKDHSLDIMKQFAQNDSRIKIIDKANSGYGNSMNVGINAATGEYLGIVEPDDYVDLHMFEDLARIADQTGADIVKADFYRFLGEGENLQKKYFALDSHNSLYGKLLDPETNQEVFKCVMNTWSGIYRLSFLNQYHIRHNETPGASFQDNGFWFQGFCLSHKIYFVNHPYYMNRRDNPNSSVHNKAKVYCANDEYLFIKQFLVNSNLYDKFKDIFYLKLWHNCCFTYGRIGDEFKLEYLQRVAKDFSENLQDNVLNNHFFSENEKKKISDIVRDYKKYYLQKQKDNQQNQKQQNLITGCIKCFQQHGFTYTVKRILVHLGLLNE